MKLIKKVLMRLKNKKVSKTPFTWNQKLQRLESDDPKVYIHPLYIYIDISVSEWVLHYYDKRIGFATEAPAEILDSGQRVWKIVELCIEIIRGTRNSGVLSDLVRFSNREEQTTIINIIEDGLSGYFGNPHPNINIQSKVVWSDVVRNAIQRGYYLRQKPSL